jgi:hypothetical protein
MSMSDNIMIAGTQLIQQSKYYSTKDTEYYNYSSKGIVYFFDINDNMGSSTVVDINDITLLTIKDKYLISSVAHYSIYNTNTQNILLFSLDSKINIINTNPVKDPTYNGTFIYQFVEENSLIIPYMIPSDIGNNLINEKGYLNGYSMDFIESNTSIYNLTSIVGNIPDLTLHSINNEKGNIFFLENVYNSKVHKSIINPLTPNIYMNELGINNIIYDQFGYKVKTLYVDIQNYAYLMVINRISNINSELMSHAFLIKISLDDLLNKTPFSKNDNIEDSIQLKGYQIIDANGTVCDGDSTNSRIIFYLSILKITDNVNTFKSKYALNTDIFDSTVENNPSQIIQVIFDYNSTTKKYNKNYNKIFSGFPALYNGEQPYIVKSEYIGTGTETPCYLFGKKFDVANANMRIPYKDSTELYRTNFLLTNKKYENKGYIYNTATLYCDRVIEELSHDVDYFKTKNFNNFYNDIYKKGPEAITNIELFTYPCKGSGDYYTTPYVNKGSSDYNIDYCSNIIFSNNIENIETTNDCEFELPQYMAISNIYVDSVKSSNSMIGEQHESNIIIYKNRNSYY